MLNSAINAIIGKPQLFIRFELSYAKSVLIKLLAAIAFISVARAFGTFASESFPDFKYNGYGVAIIFMATLFELRWGAITLFLILAARLFIFKESQTHDGLINIVHLSINSLLIFAFLLISNKRAARRERDKIEQGIVESLSSVVKTDLQDSAIFDSEMRFIAVSESWAKEFLPEEYQSNYVGRSHYEVLPWTKERFEADHKLVLSGQSIHRDTHVFTDSFGRGHICSWKAMPWRKADGSVGGILISGQNQKLLFEASRKQALLITELNHRTKNTLAMVNSIARQSGKNGTSSQFVESYCARILALSKTHDLIMQMNGKPCSLSDLIAVTIKSIPSAEARIHFRNSDIQIVNDDATQALGMTFYELLTNALKYGALSNSTGTVSIKDEIVESPTGPLIALSWEELGGPKVIEPSQTSYGLELVTEKLEYALSGRVEIAFKPKGFYWRLTTNFDNFVMSETIQ